MLSLPIILLYLFTRGWKYICLSYWNRLENYQPSGEKLSFKFQITIIEISRGVVHIALTLVSWLNHSIQWRLVIRPVPLSCSDKYKTSYIFGSWDNLANGHLRHNHKYESWGFKLVKLSWTWLIVNVNILLGKYEAHTPHKSRRYRPKNIKCCTPSMWNNNPNMLYT